MKKHFALGLLTLLLTPLLFGCGTVVTQTNTNNPDNEITEEVQAEPNEIIQLSDNVIVKEYDDYKIVSADDGKLEVRLPKEVGVWLSSNPTTLFKAEIYGPTQPKDINEMKDGAVLIFNTQSEKNKSYFLENPNNTIKKINNVNFATYSKEYIDENTNKKSIYKEFIYLDSLYSIGCSVNGPQQEKFLEQCEDIFINNITIKN